ncbi:uncharacterized protein LOC131290556 [Anopheles ziemanni]|nr:uncharacterized protein LOC131290556 [Anopheles ziemanni]
MVETHELTVVCGVRRKGSWLSRWKNGCAPVAAVVLLGALLLNDPVTAITVRDDAVSTTTTPGVNARSAPADEPVTGGGGLACQLERPFLFERSARSSELFLLDAAGLHRIDTDGLGTKRMPVCTLPKRYEEARMLQVLEVQLGEKEYVLFVVTTDQWHNVYLANGGGSSSSSSSEVPSKMVHSAQPVQRIKYSGTVSKARLLECNGNIYLVTIVTYGNLGKIRVYRWMQSYFSLESTKEIVSIDDVQCHCPSTLLLLVVDYAPLPERSLVHVLLLDAAERPVKVQEMFFLSSPLHSFALGAELYLIRHVSNDKSYLYQWDAEGKFVRLRKVPYRPGQITAVAYWDSTLAVALDGTVRLFQSGKQQLLRVESPFTVRSSARQSEATTQLVPAQDAGGPLTRLYGMRTDTENEVALATEFSCSVANGTALKIYHLTVKSVARAAEGTAQEQGFRALASCLDRLKHDTNERKKWIDLIRAQLSRKNLVFDKLAQTGAGLSARLHPTALLGSVAVTHDKPALLLPPTRTVLNGHTLLLRHFRMAADLNQVLLLNRERTEIQGDLHVAGDVRTRSSKIRAVNSLDESARRHGLGRVAKRATASSAPRVLRAREIISDSTLSQRFVRRSKMNVLPGSVQLNTLSAGSVRVELGQINHMPLPNRQALLDGVTHGYHGHKVFRSVKSYRLNAHRFNGEPLAAEIIESGLRSASDGIAIKTDVCRSRNVLVRHTLNGFPLQRLVSAYQPIQHVRGNLLLTGPVCVKNLQYAGTLNEVPRAELLDRVTNQTITGPMFVSKGFTHSLQVQQVNGEPLANYASTTSHQTASLLTKAPVRAEKMVILGDLIANHAEQQFAPHIGTRPGDFRQLYRGKVLLNGSLRLHTATINAPNVTILERTVSSKPYQQFLLRTERQVLEQAPVAPYRTALFQYLFANTLNGAALWQFSLTHRSWQNALYLQDATVQGHVRPARISKRLHSIKRSRVDLNARVKVCNVRNFVGTLRVGHLHTRFVGEAFNPDVLLRKQHRSGASMPLPPAAPKALLGRTVLLDTAVHVRGPLRVSRINGRTAYELSELAKPAVLSRRHFRALQLDSLEVANAHVLRQATAGEHPLGDFIHRFASAEGAPTSSSGAMARSARIVVPGQVQHIAAAHVGSINLCPVERLLRETVPKREGARSIGGVKRLERSLTVSGALRVAGTIGGREAALLGRLVTRGSVAPQSIDARWTFGSVGAGYLTAKVLNRVALARLALHSDAALLLQSELFVERLLVSDLVWPERAGWAFEAYVNSAHHRGQSAIALLRCHGTVYGRVRDAGHILHELLLAPGPNTERLITGLLVFDTPHVHFANSSTPLGPARIERIAKRCLRRRTGSSPETPPVVFEHAQVLLAPDTTVVRGDLHFPQHSPLTARTVAGVNLADRLGPSANLFRKSRPRPIAAEKRFPPAGIAAHNVTLDGGGGWRALAFCSHPAACPDLALHFTVAPLTIERLLTAVHLNRVPLDGFFHAFARRHSAPATPHPIQDLLGTLTVSDLQLAGRGTILHHINGLALGELVLRATANATHQTVTGPKHFRALHLGGPLSLQHLNGAKLALLKRTLLGPLPAADPSADEPLEATVFNAPVHLPGGLHTRTLYHSRTGSSNIHHLQHQHRQRTHTPLAAMELLTPPLSYLPAAAWNRQTRPRVASGSGATVPGEVLLPGERNPLLLRVTCSDDEHALVVALTSPTSNRTAVEQRLHALEGSTSCVEVVGAAPLNQTVVLIVIQVRDHQHAAWRYDVPRGLLLPLALPSTMAGGSGCHHVRLLQPAGLGSAELMLASSTCTNVPTSTSPDATVTVGRVVRIFRLDVETPSDGFHHFQTISTGAPVTAMDVAADGTTLLLKSAGTNRVHRYAYNSVEGWTRKDILP